jgi:uncharacterized integral membrane protein (TIGR00698 family)
MTGLGGESRASRLSSTLRSLLPGLALCCLLAAAASIAQAMEERSFGHPYVEALVVALLGGTACRAVWVPGARFRPGIAFGAKQVLEVAIVLLGASLSLGAIAASGPALLSGIVVLVALAIGASYAISRALGLPPRMSILVACGNSICGNSAIAAVAPVIGADSRDVAAAIAFTAVLGVLVVLALPLLVPLAGLGERQYGVLAGLTVYAVPQVLAATVPVGFLAVQVGTLVKLVRVLMLGPVVLVFSLLAPRLARDGERPAPSRGRFHLAALVPWFIVGFLGLALLRSLSLIPDAVLSLVMPVATLLTVMAMAALGLGVDLKVLSKVGGRVTLAVTLSLVVLIAISVGLIRLLGVA